MIFTPATPWLAGKAKRKINVKYGVSMFSRKDIQGSAISDCFAYYKSVQIDAGAQRFNILTLYLLEVKSFIRNQPLYLRYLSTL